MTGHVSVRYWPGGTRAAVSAGSSCFLNSFTIERLSETRGRAQVLERVDAGVVSICPLRRHAVAADGIDGLERRLGLAEDGRGVHVADVVALAVAVRAGTG